MLLRNYSNVTASERTLMLDFADYHDASQAQKEGINFLARPRKCLLVGSPLASYLDSPDPARVLAPIRNPGNLKRAAGTMLVGSAERGGPTWKKRR